MAVFLFIGKNLKLPFSAVFALGKFGNLHDVCDCDKNKKKNKKKKKRGGGRMDTERMKRVLERVYGPAAPTEEKKPPDALREAIRLEAEAAARLRYLMCTSRACQNAFGEALRRCETRRRTLHAEFFLRERGGGRRSFAPAPRRASSRRCGRSCFLARAGAAL